jgi:hypothetical protein
VELNYNDIDCDLDAGWTLELRGGSEGF